MDKGLFISLFCIILVFTCILCWASEDVPYYGATQNTVVETSVPEETTKAQQPTEELNTDKYIKEGQFKSLQISQGSVKIVEIPDNKEDAVVAWRSSDEKIATVDSGGRVDGVKEGEAVITAYFSDNTKSECEVTVTEKEESIYDGFTTGIIDNTDILNSNIRLFKDRKSIYHIKVNRQMNCVTVYTYDENGEYTVPVRAMVCSCGLDDGTITGDYKIYFNKTWNKLLNDVYGYYVSGISGDYLFHSVPFYTTSPDKLEVEEFNKLGENASLGCVRMAVADVKWLYDNCPVGTPVTLYDDENPGPLGKPETIKITDSSCGWDPTDSDKKNPYNKKKPEFAGIEDRTISVGERFDALDGVTAVDTCSNDITDRIEVTGNVVTSRAGDYIVRYSVTDAMHRTTIKDVKITVI